MAAITGHTLVAVGQWICSIVISRAPGLAVNPYRLGEACLLVVIGITRSDRVQHLYDFPLLVLIQHRPLKQPAFLPIKALVAPWRSQQSEISAACGLRRTGRLKGRMRLNTAVAVGAVNFNRVASLSVKAPIAVTVLLEVAIDAVHALLQMDVRQVHGLLELVGIVRRNRRSTIVQKFAFAIAFVDGAVVPSMAMKIGELS